MKNSKKKLNTEEKAILTAFESGKLYSIPNLASEKERIQKIAKKSKKKKHTLLSVAHEMAKGLYKANIIDEVALREFKDIARTS